MKLFRNGDCWLTGLRGQACGCASPYPTIMQSPALPHAQLQPGPGPSLRHRLCRSPCPLLPSALSPRCPDTHPSVAHRLWCPGRLSCPWATASCPHFARPLLSLPPSLRQPGKHAHTQARGLPRRCEHACSHAHAVFGQGFCALAQSPRREPVYWDPGVGCRNKRSFVQVYVKVTNSK